MKRISTITPVLDLALTPFVRPNPERAFQKALTKATRAAGVAATSTPIEEDGIPDSLRFLLTEFAKVPRLRSIGWLSAVADVQSRLENYFRIQRLHAAHPEIADEPIERPIMVVGLPRTATTLTHNIIANSPGHRGPLLWEMMHTDLDRGEAAARRHVQHVDRAMRTVARLAPAMMSIHPQVATRADEDIFWQPSGPHHLARAPMPAYERWLHEQRDAGQEYRYLKQALQVLQYGRERRRWVLKNPMHLEHLPELLGVFPDAAIVWMHRDPVTVIGSLCSAIETSIRLHVRRPDLHHLGTAWLARARRMVERGRAAGLQLPRGRIIDVPYDWLTSDPHRAVPELYDLLGASWTARDDAALEAILARPSTRLHEYELSRYGLDTNDIDDAFGDYARFAHLPGPRLR